MNEKNTKNRILKHARNLRLLIIAYSVVFIGYCILSFGFPDILNQLFGDSLRSLYVTAMGLPITAYAIWYVLQVAPIRQVSKTNKILGLLFFGVIGMWMTFPLIHKIQKQLERRESGFSFGE